LRLSGAIPSEQVRVTLEQSVTRCQPFGSIRHGAMVSTVGRVTTLAEAVAEGIRALRARRRLSQRELGALVGLHERTISDLERGRRPLTLDAEVLAFCTALDCTLPQLLAFADPEDLARLGLR
jgi:DNA-binding Xre family transcriptional regulator